MRAPSGSWSSESGRIGVKARKGRSQKSYSDKKKKNKTVRDAEEREWSWRKRSRTSELSKERGMSLQAIREKDRWETGAGCIPRKGGEAITSGRSAQRED